MAMNFNRLAGLRMFQGRKPDPAGVYRLLKQMAKGGLVLSALELSASGPVKRLNQLTAEGRRCLRTWENTMQAFQEAVSQLLKAIRASRRR